MCCREPNLPLRHVLQQVKLAHGAEFSVNVTIVACFFFSQPFRLHCFINMIYIPLPRKTLKDQGLMPFQSTEKR
jgi:hypothetical protein